MAVKIQPSIIDKRFSSTDFKKACVLNEDVKFETINQRKNRKHNNSTLKKTQTLRRRRTY